MTTPTQYAALYATRHANLRVSSATNLTPGPAQQSTVHHTTARTLCQAGWCEVQDTHDGRWLVILEAGRALLDASPDEATALVAMTTTQTNRPVPVPTTRQQYDKLSSTTWTRLCAQLPGGERTPTEGRNAHIDRVYALCQQYYMPSVPNPETTLMPKAKPAPVATDNTPSVASYLAHEQTLVPITHTFFPDLDGTIATLFESENDYLPRTLEEMEAYVEGGETWTTYHASNPYVPTNVIETPTPIPTPEETPVSTPKKSTRPTIASLTAENAALRDEVTALKKANAEYATAYDANQTAIHNAGKVIDHLQKEVATLTAKPTPAVAASVAPPVKPVVAPKPVAKPSILAPIPDDATLKGMHKLVLAEMCEARGIRLPNGWGHSALYRLLIKARDQK